MAVFQPDRWKQIKDNSVKAGVSLGLSEDFVDKLLQAIHQESVAQQNQIMVKKEEKNLNNIERNCHKIYW